MALPKGAINTQPDNVNFLSPLGYRFSIRKLPHVNYFVQTANIPNVQLGVAELPGPFVNHPIAGDHLVYSEFELNFKIDEDMQNYVELYNWMTELGFPESFSQAKHIYDKQDKLTAVDSMGEGPYSDGTLTILNSAMRPSLSVTFEQCFPIALSDITFTTTAGSVDYLECTCSFRYSLFKIARISSGGNTDTAEAPVLNAPR